MIQDDDTQKEVILPFNDYAHSWTAKFSSCD